MRRTSSIIPCKKDNLSVYNIRKVYFASLLSFLKNKDTSIASNHSIEKEDRKGDHWSKGKGKSHASVSQSQLVNIASGRVGD